MSLTAFLRPSLTLYSPRQRSANDALPGPRINSAARQAMRPAQINTSSKSGLPRDPEQWTDEDLATCARKHFKLGRTAPLLALIDDFRMTPAALWYLQTDDEELSRLTKNDVELKDQVIDLALHIRPAVSPTSPRRMNAMQLSVALDIPDPAPPPPPPPEEPEDEEEDDDALARSVVSDWALDEQPDDDEHEQPAEVSEQPAQDAHHTETRAAEEDASFTPPGGALGLDTTGGEHVEPQPEPVPEQTESAEPAEDLIDLGDDTGADGGVSVPISQAQSDDAAEAETTESGGEAPAQDPSFTDEDESSEHQRSVTVHDEPVAQDEYESLEPSRTGTPSIGDIPSEDDSSATAKLEPETELEPEPEALTEEPYIDDPAPSTQEHISSEAPPQASAEEPVAGDNTATPSVHEHEDHEGTGETSPEPEAVLAELRVDEPAVAEAEEPAAQAEAEDELSEEQRSEHPEALFVPTGVQAAGEREDSTSPELVSTTPEEPAHAEDPHVDLSEDDQGTTSHGWDHDADEYDESHDNPTTPTPETREQSEAPPSHPPADLQSPAEEPQLIVWDAETSATSEDVVETEPETHAADETAGAEDSTVAASTDDSGPAPEAAAEEHDSTSSTRQSSAAPEPEHVDDEKRTVAAPLTVFTSSPGTSTPSEPVCATVKPIQKPVQSSPIEPQKPAKRGWTSLFSSTPSPVTPASPIAFGAASPSSNKFSMGMSFGGGSTFSPPSVGFSFSQAASRAEAVVTPPAETTQDVPSAADPSESMTSPEEPRSPAEHEKLAIETVGEEGEAPASDPEARSAVEADVADAMHSSFLEDGAKSSTEHAEPVRTDAQESEEAATESDAAVVPAENAEGELDDTLVVVSPAAVQAPLPAAEQDEHGGTSAALETEEKEEKEGDDEGGWQQVGKPDVPQAEPLVVAVPDVTPQDIASPAPDQDDADEDGGDDDENADGGSEGTKGGAGGAAKNKRKKASGSKKKKKKKS